MRPETKAWSGGKPPSRPSAQRVYLSSRASSWRHSCSRNAARDYRPVVVALKFHDRRSILADRQPATGNSRTRTDCSVTVTIAPSSNASSIPAQNAPQQRHERRRVEPLLPNAYRGRAAFASCHEQRMKIRIERDAYRRLHPGTAKDFAIGGTAHADIGDVHHVPTVLGQQSGCRTRQALIEQKPPQAASSGCTLSSRLRAA